ncbi:hypothetical protein DIPPA_26041 [Diplonema papillatum]|nr:hypothetical protein DIPPA_26041 [Diplonema papillatum]
MSAIIRRLRRMEERWDNLTEAYHTHPLIRQTKRKVGYYTWVGTVYFLMGTGCYLLALNVMMLINKERKARLEGPLLARKQRDTVASVEVVSAVQYATHSLLNHLWTRGEGFIREKGGPSKANLRYPLRARSRISAR